MTPVRAAPLSTTAKTFDRPMPEFHRISWGGQGTSSENNFTAGFEVDDNGDRILPISRSGKKPCPCKEMVDRNHQSRVVYNGIIPLSRCHGLMMVLFSLG